MKTILIALNCYFATFICCLAQGSIETLGQLRYDPDSGKKSYGVGLDFGVRLNRYVLVHARAVAYSQDDWRGGVIDEGSLLVEGELFRSANKKLVLSAIGGGDRDFESDVWGLSAGARARWFFTPRLSAVAETRVRVFERSDLEVVPSVGLSFGF